MKNNAKQYRRKLLRSVPHRIRNAIKILEQDPFEMETNSERFHSLRLYFIPKLLEEYRKMGKLTADQVASLTEQLASNDHEAWNIAFMITNSHEPKKK